MNIFVVEDSLLIRKQLLLWVNAEPRIKLAGTTDNEESAVEFILTRHPEVVLLDLALSPGSGLNVLKRIRAAGSPARVLILSNNYSELMREACSAHGIDGFFDKSHGTRACFERLYSWLPTPGKESV